MDTIDHGRLQQQIDLLDRLISDLMEEVERAPNDALLRDMLARAEGHMVQQAERLRAWPLGRPH